MTSVETARRVCRHLKSKDPAGMDPGDASELLDAINAGLDEFYRLAPTIYRRTTATETLLAPVSRSVTIANGATTTTGSPFLTSERGKSILIPGDSAYNEIVSTNQVLRPYQGTEAASGATATIYSDAVAIRDFTVERLVNEPKIIEHNRVLMLWEGQTPGRQLLYPFQETARQIGEPRFYRVDFVGGSLVGGSDDAVLIVRMDPMPSRALTFQVDLEIRAANLGLDSLGTAVEIPIHASIGSHLFLPLIEEKLLASSLWQGGDLAVKIIQEQAQRARGFIHNLTDHFTVPNNRIGTPEGW